MPQCRNAPKAYYKGTEPSPKGRGYCASSEKMGTKMFGLDNQLWIIKTTKTNTKRWFKHTVHKHYKTSQTIDLRLIVGYYHDHDHDSRFPQSQTPQSQTPPPLTKSQLKDVLNRKLTWEILNSVLVNVQDELTTYPQIQIHNIKKISIQNAPHKTPTLKERITQKYKYWYHNPKYIIVIDLKQVPLFQSQGKHGGTNDITHPDALKIIQGTINHGTLHSNGWISNFYDVGDNSHLSLVQIGYYKDKLKPDYRKFSLGI